MKKERIAGLAPARKIGGLALTLLMLIGMVSCGGNNDPNTAKLEIKPELGDLGSYITIESKDATINLSEYTEDGDPYIKLASTIQVKVKEDVASDYSFHLDVEILDANMNVITDFGDYEIESMSDYDVDTYHHYLKAGEHRAIMDESGPKKDWEGKSSAMWELIREKGKYIVLKPSYSSAKFKPYTGAVESDSSSDVVEDTSPVVESDEVATASGEDWDQILNEYEAYCNKVISYAKKAQAGDVTAITQYTSLLESAESLQRKLENASANLSAAQVARLNKIAAKMASAMM